MLIIRTTEEIHHLVIARMHEYGGGQRQDIAASCLAQRFVICQAFGYRSKLIVELLHLSLLVWLSCQHIALGLQCILLGAEAGLVASKVELGNQEPRLLAVEGVEQLLIKFLVAS